MVITAQTIKHLAFSFFLFIILYSLFIIPTPIYAQSSTTAQQANPAIESSTNPDVPKNLHTYTQNVMIEVMATTLCQLTGIDPVNPNQQCLGVDPKTNKIGFVKGGGGTIGIMGSMIAMTYNAPLHTGDYFGYLAQNFGVTKPAYAQTTGSGFDGLKPLIELWAVFRNFVYLLFIAVFIIIGFGIMLRINIDPRTVMAISNQLPKIIVAILLVTFSFAIAGFMIDVMWTSIYVTYNVFADAALKSNVVLSTDLNPTNMEGKMAFDAAGGFGKSWKIADNIATGGRKTAISFLGIDEHFPLPSIDSIIKSTIKFDGPFGVIGTPPFVKIPTPVFDFKFLDPKEGGISPTDWFVHLLSVVTGGGVAYWISTGFNLPGGGLVAYPLGFAAGFLGAEAALRQWIPYLLFFIVVFIAIVTALFKIWFSLVMAYIGIIVDVIFAPFWIIAGLIPGSPIGFGAWFKDMLVNLSVFPVTIGMFLLGNIFVEIFKKPGGAGSGLFVPPLIGNPGDTSFFGAVIGLGIILMTPRAMAIVKDIIKTPEFKHTGAIGQAIGTGLGATNLPSHWQKINQLGYYSGHWRQLPFIGGMFGGEKTQAGGRHTTT